MEKAPRKARIPKHYGTLKEFAEACGGAKLTTVSGWIRNPKWRWVKKAPFPSEIVPEVLRWAAEELERGRPTGTSDDEVKELRREKLRNEVRKLLAAAETVETALAVQRGKLVDAAEVESAWAGIGVVLRNAFQNLGAQLVPLALTHGMPNQAAPTFQNQVEEAVAGILRRLSSSDAPEDDSDGAA